MFKALVLWVLAAEVAVASNATFQNFYSEREAMLAVEDATFLGGDEVLNFQVEF